MAQSGHVAGFAVNRSGGLEGEILLTALKKDGKNSSESGPEGEKPIRWERLLRRTEERERIWKKEKEREY